jgi:hypothetical protein
MRLETLTGIDLMRNKIAVDRSLQNLEIGRRRSRVKKVQVTITILPETKEWLMRSGNISKRIDLIVEMIMDEELIGGYQLKRLREELAKMRKELQSKNSVS